jgi:16S rRNA (guanine1516-N2)-methyltransferase
LKIFSSEPLSIEQENHCSQDLQAKIVTAPPESEFYLEFSPTTARVSLKRNQSNEHGIFVDFESDEARYNQQRISVKKDLLARAIGVEAGLSICDLTMGLAGDAFKLCYFGAKVFGLEKDHNVWALVENAKWRYQAKKPLALKAMNDDCVNQLPTQLKDHDVFYLDPMFDLARTALPRKGMQYLDQLTFPTPQADLEQIMVQLKDAKKKLVVKRALKSDWLCGYKPQRSSAGKMVRFDIYL